MVLTECSATQCLSAILLCLLSGVTLRGEAPPQPVSHVVTAPGEAYNVLVHGAAGDGRTNEAAAIQKAIDACSQAGGGRVLLPAGRTYLSGTIRLKANVDLHLETGAILKGTTDGKAYGPQRALIVAQDCNNVSITGGGTIDGDSPAWMDGLMDDIFRPKRGRPGLMYLRGCRQVTLTGVAIRNCAAWTVHLLGCEDVLIQGIRIRNDLRVPNCDGIDPDRCRNVRIAHCFIQAGDDGIVAKCTRESPEYGPCENIVVTGCTIVSRSCALKIGTESYGDFRNLVFDACVVYNSNRGLGIQLRDTGTVENVIFSNIVVNTQSHGPLWWGKAEPIYVTAVPRTAQTKLGKVRNIRFSNILCRGENGVFLHGSQDHPLEDIVLDNVRVEIGKWTTWPGGFYDLRPGIREGVYEHKIAGIYVQHALGVTLGNVKVAWGETRPGYFGSALETHDARGLELTGFKGQAAHPGKIPDRIVEE